jgi:hypothetical protein
MFACRARVAYAKMRPARNNVAAIRRDLDGDGNIPMTTTAARVRALAVTVALAAGLSLVPATAALASGPGSATFTLTGDGAPLVSQFASISGPDSQPGFTDGSGVVSFTDLALGDYTLDVASSDFPEFHLAFTLTDSSPSLTLDVALPPWPGGTGAVTGTVTDRTSGEPIAGAEVQGFRTDAPGRNPVTTTDANGVYVLTGLLTSTYWVQATAPDHFPVGAETSVTDGLTSTVDLSLLASDSTIEGRVVDPDGVGVEGIQVNASSPDGSVYDTTDSDGTYSMPGAGAGTWTVTTFPTTEWELSSVDIEVAAEAVEVVPDLVLVPRFTGTISGLVASSDGIPEAQIGGFFDICVTVLTSAGVEVPGASTVTGGDSFFYFWVAPGDYTVYFEDCDADREPHGYQSTYLGGSTEFANATIVTVETNVDLWLDTTTLEPQASNPEPDHDAVPVAKNKLKKATKNLIDAPEQVRRGETFEILVGTAHAGDWVSAWVYSEPLQIGGWHQVAADGTIEVTLPAGAPLGTHRLSVQDADDHLIGWAKVDVKKAKKH